MRSFSIENLFCCPICKSSLIYNCEVFTCSFCGQRFSKKGDIYDFRVKIDAGDKNQRDKFEQLILRNEDLGWFTIVLKHLSPAEYRRILRDPHLKEIEEHINKLLKEGVNVGERYDSTLLPEGSIRDLRELIIALRYIPRLNNKDIAIDLGCGTLRVTKQLSKMGFKKVIAIDLLSEMMLYGYSKLNDEDKKKVILVQADARFLPLKDCSIDLIFSLLFFEHIDAPFLLLLDIERVLKNDGVAIINSWNGLGISNRKNITQKGKSYYENGFYYRWYELKEVASILRKLNFNFDLKCYDSLLGRKFMLILGEKFGKLLLKPFILIDEMLSFFLPQFLFALLIFRFRKEQTGMIEIVRNG